MSLFNVVERAQEKYVQAKVLRSAGLALVVLCACLRGSASRVILIDQPGSTSAATRQLESATSFYGLDLEVKTPGRGGSAKELVSAIRDEKTLAVVIDAGVLQQLDRDQLLDALRHAQVQIPLMIAGIDEHTSSALLSQWSAGAIVGSTVSAPASESSWYEIARKSEVTQQLSGEELPLARTNVPTLMLDGGRGTQPLLEVQRGSVAYPVFVRTPRGGHDLFFAADTRAPEVPVSPDPYRQQSVFASLAPSLLFLHFAAGERAWHSPGSYANFTIDDLWLREPYGHVNYEGLLRQSEVHNFHTTVAFIPWNFERSQPEMVALFRKNPDRLSICIHGNNHIHQEFGPLDSHPIAKQTDDMKQALARMERFSALTGIPYDAVMVFPHSVGPEMTFSGLKRYNYLATANSLNVPLDAVAPANVEYALRTATLRFADFPSYRRYSAETDIPESQLAIDAFLGNPMLFYSHESFFASGNDAFNKTADTVNRLEPNTEWSGLGNVARHSYIERLRDDGDYDIRSFSGTIDLANHGNRETTYFIEKDEDFAESLTVLVDGQPFPFDRSGSELRVRVSIPAGKSRAIAIRYQNDLNLAQIPMGMGSKRVKAIRLLSDFRDNAVSNTRLGRIFIKNYADNGPAFNRAFVGLTGLVLVGIVIFRLKSQRRRAKLQPHATVLKV